MFTSIDRLLFTLRDGGGQVQASEFMARCADGVAAKPGREYREASARMKRLSPCAPPSPG